MLLFLSFFLQRYAHSRDLHSFPTRRSSDLDHDGPRHRHDAQCPHRANRPADLAPGQRSPAPPRIPKARVELLEFGVVQDRSEEHTSELQSRRDLVCRLLLEKKKQI